jgi:hypothetical protein
MPFLWVANATSERFAFTSVALATSRGECEGAFAPTSQGCLD